MTVRDCVPEHLRMELRKLGEVGCETEVGKDWIRVIGPSRPGPVDFATLPYPGFHTDMHPQMVALLSIASGTSVITGEHLCSTIPLRRRTQPTWCRSSLEGQHVIIRGVDRLSGCPVDACDIRAGAALVLAGLTAEGIRPSPTLSTSIGATPPSTSTFVILEPTSSGAERIRHNHRLESGMSHSRDRWIQRDDD